MIARSFVLLACAAFPLRCDLPGASGTSAKATAASASYPHMEAFDDAAPPVYVLRGGPHGPAKIVFLHGMCGHALGYAQSFQFSAAKKGVLIAPQGDVSCGGPWSKWSLDLAALDRRITDTFRALGVANPDRDITVVGYSQGAARAEELTRKWPERYTRLVAMAGPTTVNPAGLSARAVATMAGTRDRQDLMMKSAERLARAGIPAKFFSIPEATHGSMGPHPEQTMGEVLDWLFAPPQSGGG